MKLRHILPALGLTAVLAAPLLPQVAEAASCTHSHTYTLATAYCPASSGVTIYRVVGTLRNSLGQSIFGYGNWVKPGGSSSRVVAGTGWHFVSEYIQFG